jgi:hypothetical protein
MFSRSTLCILLAGTLIALGVATHRQDHLSAWGYWLQDWWGGEKAKFSARDLRTELLSRMNEARLLANIRPLRQDAELQQWLDQEFATMPLEEMDAVTRRVQERLPRYYRVSVCTAGGPTVRALMDEFREFSRRTQGEMTHLACAVRSAKGGLARQALVVLGQRLEDFSPEALNESQADAFYSACPHCRHAHVVRVSRQQRSLGLECPQCRRTYAVVAADERNQFRYVNEFLTGYAPPAVFAKARSRLSEMFTIWSAVHANCSYTRDPGGRHNQTDTWQTSLETQRTGLGDCEDSSIFLCDWLISRGFQARVALGRYGDLGGHAWCVVRVGDDEYLLESTEGKPDPQNPPLVSRVGSRYVAEILFDRFALYVRAQPGQRWQGDYWSPETWVRVEPRAGKPLPALVNRSVTKEGEAKMIQPNPAAAPFRPFEQISPAADVWQTPLPGLMPKPEIRKPQR